MKFDIKNRRTGDVQFTAEIECAEDAPLSIKIGLSVKWALENGVGLSGADLSRADLSRADLSRADLSGADLSRANLFRANLFRADLFRADLSDADLARANFSDAYLADANLARAYLSDANLADANLADAENVPSIPQTIICPTTGAFEGWKSCRNGVLVHLLIPADAKRSNATGRKCRASHVKVIKVIGAAVGVSKHDSSVEYLQGNIVRCDEWCDDRWQECGGGIHFFITREEAEAWL